MGRSILWLGSAAATLLWGSVAAAQDTNATNPTTDPAPAATPPPAPTTTVASGTTSSGTASSGTAGSSTSGAQDPDADESASSNFTLQQLGLAQKKWWQVGAIFETHRLLRQDDLGGAARNKALNYLQIYAGFKPGKMDQISVRGGFTQRFLSDESETGIRPDDITLTYTRTIPLPYEVVLRPSVGNLFPTSFESKLMGLISSPRANVTVMRNFLDQNLTVNVRLGGAGYITEYRQMQGGGTSNPFASVSTGIGVNYSMPFHNALQLGANLGTSWYWNYDVEHVNDPNLSAQFKNTPIQPSSDPQFATQPVQQTYGGEIYVGYQLPQFFKAQSNVQLAVSQGEPNVIHDGRTNVYWMFRRSAQVYAALQVQY